MKTWILLTILICWFSLGVVVSFYAQSDSGQIVIALFMLVGISIASLELFSRSSGLEFLLNTRKSKTSKLNDDLSRMAFYLKGGARGRSYGRKEVAKILREAMFTKYYGFENYPRSWIATSNGDDAIREILRSKNAYDLLDIFVVPEDKDDEVKISRKSKSGYLPRLTKALTLIDDRRLK